MKYMISLLLGLMLASQAAQAVEKRYVTDKLYIQLRSGPSNEYRILKVVQSGEHLIYLGEEGDFTHVKTTKGVEGYVRTQYLVNEPVAKENLILANRELDNIKAELTTARNQVKELTQELETAKSERADASRSSTELERELERIRSISENAVALDEKARKLTRKTQELELQVSTLSAENQELRGDRSLSYLIYGGGLIVVGIIGGLILPGLRGRRSNSGWA
ncbi:TIGR04211 family SH3 domain-containing protein [Thalassolituus sp. UBA3500]|uniref:TIGR04211 family SH3 domain-containing protein n=2 Tax=unclassified Thalassolituus TaxID=2624967 RepID=UPI00263A99A7|nr:TIGR04211 family SH3 domain-containing protein [Thalassolituus sp. UBA3500]